MPAATFMRALDLDGRVIRNSEFTDAAEKEAGARLYLSSCGQIYLILCEVVGDLLKEISENQKNLELT